MSDRTVHARWNGHEIVRYDTAGKWYREYDGTRIRISFNAAVTYGKAALKAGEPVYFGRPGGSRFDARVRA
jgi:hypothetical protein